MKNSNANVRAVDSSSTHKYPWKWYLSDLEKVQKNGLTVFSTFSCGGGSSMGYKLAGYDVIGNVEIDPRVMAVYKKNNHPHYSFLMDVREFLKLPKRKMPDELFNLDILDGSPPCSVFSTAGEREKGWNKEKVFREGQAKQKLDDLFFYFIGIAQRLQPKVVIAENVSGLLKGNAKGYVNEIFKAFDAAGYKTQLFLLNAAFMGVPQKRERCFFVAQRKDQAFPKLTLNFREKPILFGEVRGECGETATGKDAAYLKKALPSDKYVSWIEGREKNRQIGNFRHIIADVDIAPTIVSAGTDYRQCDKKKLSEIDFRNVQTFPQDYDFGDQTAKYICGMSVPPVMMAQIANEVYKQWLRRRLNG